MSDIPNLELQFIEGEWLVTYRDATDRIRASYPLAYLLDDAIENHLSWDFGNQASRRALISELTESADRLGEADRE